MLGLDPKFDLLIIFIGLILVGLMFWGLFKIGVPLRRIFKPFYVILIVLIVTAIYGWNRWGIVADHDVGQMRWVVFVGLLTLLFYSAVTNYFYRERYKAPQFQAHGLSGSCSKAFDIGDYTIFYLGTAGGLSHREGNYIPIPMCQKICILPKEGWDMNSYNFFSDVVVEKIDTLDQLHPRLKSEILGDGTTLLARDEVYFGVYAEPVLTENPKLHEVVEKMKATNVYANAVKDINVDKDAEIKRRVTDQAAIAKKIKNIDSPPRQMVGSELE